MQISKNLIFCILLFCAIGCQNKASRAEKSNTKDTAEVQMQKTGSTKTNATEGYIKDSMVISCGSGCAMRYSPENISSNDTTIKVKFKVEMFIDEVVSDTYDETYIFSYNKSNNLEKVQQGGKPENVLENLMPAAQESFRKFGKNLMVNKNQT